MNKRRYLTVERLNHINQPGSLKFLREVLDKDESITVTDIELMRCLPKIISKILTPKQEMVFRMYYFHNYSIYEMRYQLKANSFSDVERFLTSATNRVAKYFSTKNKKENG